MEAKYDGKLEQEARNAILLALPKEAKLNIVEICEMYNLKREGNGRYFETGELKKQAEEMARTKFLYQLEKSSLVFSKDNEGQYFWKKASALDKIIAYLQ